jgi:ABC-2 type transport system ATP-binding protein
MAAFSIEVVELTKRFRHRVGLFKTRTVVALDHVSFTLQPGEALGLIGENGSGKSTLLRILSTVLLPTSGQAWVGGKPISDIAAVKTQIGLIPGDPKGFSAFLTGRQNLEFYAALQQIEPSRVRPRIEQLLQRVGISELDGQPFWSYSTGQRQRLSIARALLHDPPILFFDEPTKGLDPWMAQEVRSWIRRELIERQGKTLLIASNQMEDVEALCDRTATLRRGHLLQEGPMEVAS